MVHGRLIQTNSRVPLCLSHDARSDDAVRFAESSSDREIRTRGLSVNFGQRSSFVRRPSSVARRSSSPPEYLMGGKGRLQGGCSGGARPGTGPKKRKPGLTRTQKRLAKQAALAHAVDETGEA